MLLTQGMLLLGIGLVPADPPVPLPRLPEAEGKVERHKSGPGPTDLYGDPLPAGALCRIGSVRFRHGGSVLDVAFSPDGRSLAAADHEGVRLWDKASGKEVARLSTPPPSSVSRVAFLPHGPRLVTHCQEDGRILFWDLGRKRGRPLRGPRSDPFGTFALSADGRLLAYSRDGSLRLWDIATGKEARQLGQGEGRALRLALAADGKLLASLDEHLKVTLWDVPTGQKVRQIPPPPPGADQVLGRPFREWIGDMDLSPDGSVLVTVSALRRGPPRLWDTRTGQEQKPGQFADAPPGGVTFSPDGKFLALTTGSGIHFWEVATSRECWSTPYYGSRPSRVRFSADGRLLAGGQSHKAVVWETVHGRERSPMPEHRAGVGYIAVSADGRTVLTAGQTAAGVPGLGVRGEDPPSLRYWEARTGMGLTPPGQARQFPPLADLSADQRTLATWGNDRSVQVWDVPTGKELCRATYEDEAEACTLSPDGKHLVLASRDPQGPIQTGAIHLVLWDARSGQRLGEFQGQRGYMGEVRFSPDGKVLASISHGEHTLRLWDVATRRELYCLRPPPRVNWYLAFSRDGRVLAAAGLEPQVKFWDVASGEELPSLAGPELAKEQPSGIYALSFSPDGQRLITSDNYGKIFVWERATGRLVKGWQAHQFRVSQLALSADGNVLVSRGASTALVWDLAELLKQE